MCVCACACACVCGWVGGCVCGWEGEGGVDLAARGDHLAVVPLFVVKGSSQHATSSHWWSV